MTANIFIFITVLAWGIGAFLGKTVLQHSSSIYGYLLEALGTLSVALLVALFYKNEVVSITKNFSLNGYLFGILWGIGTVTFIIALKLKPSSFVVPLTALYPVITVILSVLFLKEEITLKITIGIIFAISATVLLA
ncbi:MAG: EamA family transporter [Candidatus Paceibacterota bacterium]|jgi:transporter family protein|nr:EamA family transporter [Candidatus Paceibacterota bacterium]